MSRQPCSMRMRSVSKRYTAHHEVCVGSTRSMVTQLADANTAGSRGWVGFVEPEAWRTCQELSTLQLKCFKRA